MIRHPFLKNGYASPFGKASLFFPILIFCMASPILQRARGDDCFFCEYASIRRHNLRIDKLLCLLTNIRWYKLFYKRIDACLIVIICLMLQYLQTIKELLILKIHRLCDMDQLILCPL